MTTLKDVAVRENKKNVIAGKIGQSLIDLDSQYVEGMVFVYKDSDEYLEILRHSCAHLMAQAVKNLYPGVKLAIGPVIADGFYYDFYYDGTFSLEDFDKIEKEMKSLAKKSIPIKRLEFTKQEAREYFLSQGEMFKVELIDSFNDETVTVYEQGDFRDLCRGPHLPNTSFIKAFSLLKCSGAYWKGDSTNPMLQRIYATAWRTQEDLNNYLKNLEERKNRDHRKIAKAMDLFHTQAEAPGMIFWHENGWVIYQILQNFIKQFYKLRYQEVRSPQLVSRSLWETSGHWEMFHHNMFVTESEKQEFAVKPMNCPCHIQIYNQSLKSYRDLPLRLAEFGCCHRNEASGTLSGLMRVRQFVQDDGHIFCALSQIASEIKLFIEQAFLAYNMLGFKDIVVRISTRPEKRVGDESAWDLAESALAEVLTSLGLSWEYLHGEGAFYGPKIELSLKDCMDRVWQCGTVQIDFSMPQRLGAYYIDETGVKKHPVMLHRAILGSLERFIGILIEEYAGYLPLWLTPVQVVVIAVSDDFSPYAKDVYASLLAWGFRVKFDDRNEKIGYKIRDNILSKIPYLIIVGKEELESGTVTIRYQNQSEQMPLNVWFNQIKSEISMPVYEIVI